MNPSHFPPFLFSYQFVFMWVPTLLSMNPPGGLPTGCVFSAMMMAITMGGVLFPPLQSLIAMFTKSKAPEVSATLVYFLAGLSMAIPALCFHSTSSGSDICFTRIVISFMVIELCVGLFMPVAATLRSKYVPDALQGAILNIFRLPLNAIVVAGTYATDVLEPAHVFIFVSGLFMTAAVLLSTMIISIPHSATASKKLN